MTREPLGRWPEVAGLRLHALDWPGPEDRPPLVFLHGSALDARVWDPVCQELGDRRRCLALDLRGHGRSGWHPDARYAIDELADDVLAVADALGAERFGLVAMSTGGLVALVVAARCASRIERLVLLDTTPYLTASSGTAIRGSVDRAARSVATTFDPAAHTAAVRDARVRRAQALVAELPRVGCPTLVVRGGCSDLVSEDNARRLAAALPEARLVTVPGARHLIVRDTPEDVLRILSEVF